MFRPFTRSLQDKNKPAVIKTGKINKFQKVGLNIGLFRAKTRGFINKLGGSCSF